MVLKMTNCLLMPKRAAGVTDNTKNNSESRQGEKLINTSGLYTFYKLPTSQFRRFKSSPANLYTAH